MIATFVAVDFRGSPEFRGENDKGLLEHTVGFEILDQGTEAAVEDVAGEVGVGQTWTDVTTPGLRPAMRTTSYDRPHQWSEDGNWKRVTAALDLAFVPTGTGCDVRFRFRITGPGPVRGIGLLASYASVLPVRADLRKAAAILGSRDR